MSKTNTEARDYAVMKARMYCQKNGHKPAKIESNVLRFASDQAKYLWNSFVQFCA